MAKLTMFQKLYSSAKSSTRMLPASKAIPKELLPILNKTIIQYVVEEAINAGINQIILLQMIIKGNRRL